VGHSRLRSRSQDGHGPHETQNIWDSNCEHLMERPNELLVTAGDYRPVQFLLQRSMRMSRTARRIPSAPRVGLRIGEKVP
jgi:hypothetical protein